jgi:hypothetical protein
MENLEKLWGLYTQNLLFTMETADVAEAICQHVVNTAEGRHPDSFLILWSW